MNKTGSLLSLMLFTQLTMAAAVQPFSLPWMNNEQQSTSYNSTDHKATVFVLENYFLNCPYCNDNAPNVDDLTEEFANNPQVQVLDVGVDKSDAQYAEWIKRHRPNHPVLKDAQKTLTKQLGTTGYPSTYILDCNGNVVFKSTGVWQSATLSKIRSKIKAALSTCVVKDVE